MILFKTNKKVFILLVTLISLLIFMVLLIVPFLLPSPTLQKFINKQNSTRFYDRNGELLYILPLEDGLRREYYKLEELPKDLVLEFVNAEDKNFYKHFGVDFFSIGRALVQNKKAGYTVSGASTITMQLVRLVYPRKNKKVTVGTKFVEMLRALSLEAKLSKDKILELYINNIPFGSQIEGVGSAARSFYCVTPDKLSPEQINKLSLIPRRPTLYSPEKKFLYPNKSPHFIRYVIDLYKTKKTLLPNTLTLSIDNSLTEVAEKNIQKKITEFKSARIHNGAALALDNRTGEILVWVGNASFDDAENSGQINGVLVQNNPGSSMKPFLYALALQEGFSPTTVIPDIQQDFGSSGVYVPQNFNNMYNGPVRFRVALASSLNIPAVYILNEIGMKKYLACLSKLQFNSLDGQKENLGLSLALGGAQVSMLEMTKAFSVFPNDGKLLQICVTKSSKDCNKTKVYEQDTSRIICDILSDKNARELGFGHAQVFNTLYPSIFKTGTSNQYQNIIALGATSRITVCAWMGNFKGQTVVGKTGSSIPAEVVKALLDELTKTYEAEVFKTPTAYKKISVCALSGLKPNKDCPSVVEEYVKTEPKKCTWHIKSNNLVQIQYPAEYEHWAHSKNIAGTVLKNTEPLKIVYPRNGATFIYDSSLPEQVQMLTVQAIGGNANNAKLFVDDVFIAEATNVFSWNVPLKKGRHCLKVECAGDKKIINYEVK